MKHLIAILCSLSLMLTLCITGYSSPVKVEKEKLSFSAKKLATDVIAVASNAIIAEVNFLAPSNDYRPEGKAKVRLLFIYLEKQQFTPRSFKNFRYAFFKPDINKRWQYQVAAFINHARRKQMPDISYC